MAKTLGKRISQIAILDKEIRATEKVLKDQKRQRAKLEARLLREFDKDDIDGVKVPGGTAHIRKADFFSIKDRRKFNKYVLKHGALDLFQNRIAANAYKARLDEGETVPGIAKYTRIGVSIKQRGVK